jgi:hypothetical protein
VGTKHTRTPAAAAAITIMSTATSLGMDMGIMDTDITAPVIMGRGVMVVDLEPGLAALVAATKARDLACGGPCASWRTGWI